ncbi:alpha/beta hydrolase [Paenibacillus abyssi]|uniref:Lysophospholipase n=1 Tax=Paenibacillus abyssi TaxID=1340531 RepID=A0A917G5W3_9BACL|nr:alpha/beta hydrolase [Paenibacillus abyssi]GGG24330.1 lysophospholipase [Paenibacillus abyssi]
MVYEELLLTANDGIELFAREWRAAEGAPRAAVCLVHGMGEHGGRYEEVASVLTAVGFVLFNYDQRGHGRSPGKRGHCDSIAQLTGDAAALINLAKQRCPGLPVFLYGHSMGGNVALSCALRLQPEITGLILTSPWLRLAFLPPAYKLWIGEKMARLWPAFSLSTGLNSANLYHDAELTMPVDPLAHNRISAGMFYALKEEGEWALANCDRLKVPLLLLHGTADNITSMPASKELADKLDKACTFYAWEDGFHELHNDRDKERMLYTVVDWIEGILKGRGIQDIEEIIRP